MKRKASYAIGSSNPAKLSKQATVDTVNQKLSSLKRQDTIKTKLEPVRLTSIRQRKAPSWLKSYVTNSSQEKEVKSGEQPKLKMPRFPTLVPPSKRGKEDVKKETKPAPLLRKQSTLKLVSSPPVSKSKDEKPFVKTPSLTRKATKVLNSKSDDSLNKNTMSRKDSSSVNKEQTPDSPKHKLVTKRVRLAVTKTKPSDSKSPSLSSLSSKLRNKPSVSRQSSRNIKEETVVNANSNVVEICDQSNDSDVTPPFKEEGAFPFSSARPTIPVTIRPPAFSLAQHKAIDQTVILNDSTQPTMLEVVLCVSTSGALREYLIALQGHIREMIWKLQSLVPNLRIGVMAHTQGGIHDDPTRGSFSGGDHNYNRMGGHSGTKWIDLGATLSQICAFVDSLESESTLYPDYVQDNLEMALWKLQRCMSWSSCSYRSVVMIGRGRPNRTTFYHQKEHWRGWIRSALELPPAMDIPVIDWELEAKLLAEMGIHVFTIQAGSNTSQHTDKEDEGTCFFRRVAEITQGRHVRIREPEKLPEIMIGICCACHGPELLMDHREAVRDENDGLLPTQLTEIFVGLQLHSKRNSLSSLPSMLGNLNIASMRQRLTGFNSRGEQSMEFKSLTLESSMEFDSIREENSMELSTDQSDERMELGRGSSSMRSKAFFLQGEGEKVNGFTGKIKVSRNRYRAKPYEVGRGKKFENKDREETVEKKVAELLKENAQTARDKAAKRKTNAERVRNNGLNSNAKSYKTNAQAAKDKAAERKTNARRVRNNGVNSNAKLFKTNAQAAKDKAAERKTNAERVRNNGGNSNAKSYKMNAQAARDQAAKRNGNGRMSERVRDNGVSPLAGKRIGKRQIKLTEKARENFTSLREGRVGKAKCSRSAVSPLHREAVKGALKAQQASVKKAATTAALSVRVAKQRVAKAEEILKSKQSQSLKGGNNSRTGRRLADSGSNGKVNATTTNQRPRRGTAAGGSGVGGHGKVSPLRRKASEGEDAMSSRKKRR